MRKHLKRLAVLALSATMLMSGYGASRVFAQDMTLPSPTETNSTGNPVIVNLVKSNTLKEGTEFGGSYGFYLTAKGKNGKDYVSNYTSISALNVDQVAPGSITGHVVVKNGSTDTNLAMILTLPRYSAGADAELILDAGRIDKNKGLVIQSQSDQDYSNLITYSNHGGEYLNRASFQSKYGADAINDTVIALYLQGGKIAANDTLELQIPLKLSKNPSEIATRAEQFQLMNFTNGHNGYATDNASVQLSHGADIKSSVTTYGKVLPTYLTKTGVAGGTDWVYDPSIQDLFPTPDKMLRFQSVSQPGQYENDIHYTINDKGQYVFTPLEPYANLLPTYILDFSKNGLQDRLTKHGYTVNPTLIGTGYYRYRSVSEKVDIAGFDRSEDQSGADKFLHFQVIPAILLHEDQYIAVSEDQKNSYYNPVDLVRQFTDPHRTNYVLAEDDPELKTASLDPSLLKVDITDVTNPSAEKSVERIPLNQAGRYRLVYSYNYNGLEISNTGYVNILVDQQQIKLRAFDTESGKEITDLGQLQTSFWGKTDAETSNSGLAEGLTALVKYLQQKGYQIEEMPTLPEHFDASLNYVQGEDTEIQYVDLRVKAQQKDDPTPQPGKKDPVTPSQNQASLLVKRAPQTNDISIFYYGGAVVLAILLIAGLLLYKNRSRREK